MVHIQNDCIGIKQEDLVIREDFRGLLLKDASIEKDVSIQNLLFMKIEADSFIVDWQLSRQNQSEIDQSGF